MVSIADRRIGIIIRFREFEFDSASIVSGFNEGIDGRCFDSFALCWDTSNFGRDISTDSIVFLIVGYIDIHHLIDEIDRCSAIAQKETGFELLEFHVALGEVIFVLDVTDKSFEHVFESNDTRSTAIFIDNDSEVDFALAEFFEEVAYVFGDGNEEGVRV